MREALEAEANREQAVTELRELLGVAAVSVHEVIDGSVVALEAEGLRFLWGPGRPVGGLGRGRGIVYVTLNEHESAEIRSLADLGEVLF